MANSVLSGLFQQNDVALRQIQDMFEFHWFAVEFTGNYTLDVNKLDYLILSRKSTRDFKQVLPKESQKEKRKITHGNQKN